jgi:hypothetical protein
MLSQEPIILATPEVGIRRIMVRGQPRKTVCEILSQKSTPTPAATHKYTKGWQSSSSDKSACLAKWPEFKTKNCQNKKNKPKNPQTNCTLSSLVTSNFIHFPLVDTHFMGFSLPVDADFQTPQTSLLFLTDLKEELSWASLLCSGSHLLASDSMSLPLTQSFFPRLVLFF